MLISTLIKEMDLVGSCDGNGGIDGDVGHRNSYDSLMIAFQVLDLGLWKETHSQNNDLKFKCIPWYIKIVMYGTMIGRKEGMLGLEKSWFLGIDELRE